VITADNAAFKNLSFSSELYNRYLVLVTIAYLAGIISGYLWLAESSYLVWFTALLVIIFGYLYRSGLIGFYKVCLLILVVLSGAVSCYYFTLPAKDSIIHYAGIDPVSVEGIITEEPLFFEDHSAYLLQVEKVETRAGAVNSTGRLLVKVYDQEADHYQFGERLRIRASIVEPKGLRNPGGFDYKFYLRSQGIDALAYPYSSRIESIGSGATNPIIAAAINLRIRLKVFIDSTLPSPASDLLVAILFGQRERLPENIEENFRKAGTGHLMAVSGLHVGLVAALVLGLWRLFHLQGRLPLVLAIVLVLAYAFLTGMRPSAVRAALMVSLSLGALLVDREKDLITAVAFAALFSLFINPLNLFAVGFQLSYAATLALIYCYRPLEKLLKILRMPPFLLIPVGITLAAQVGVLPLSIYYFHYLPVGALFFNLLLLPLVAFIVGLGLAGALAGLLLPLAGELLLWAVRPLLEFMILLTGFSNMPGFYIGLNPPGFFELLIIYGAMIVFLILYYQWERYASFNPGISFAMYCSEKFNALPAGRKKPVTVATLVVMSAAVILVWSGFIFPRQQPLTLTFIDVGQGAAVLIETPWGANILVDAGGEPAYSGDPGIIGEKVVLPFLRYRGIKRIDLAVITHPHEDHFGGYLYLLEQIPINQFIISPVAGDSPYYENLLQKAEATGIPVLIGSEGDSWQCETDFQLAILSPPAGLIRGNGSEQNNNSLVILLQYEAIKVLLTGDVEDSAVIDLLSRYPGLKADLLQIPHHGGCLPSLQHLLLITRPDYAVIQVGTNSFGHPHPSVIEALTEAGVQIYRNDWHGAITFQTNGKKFEVFPTVIPVQTEQ
jgi:competence protein ComEC